VGEITGRELEIIIKMEKPMTEIHLFEIVNNMLDELDSDDEETAIMTFSYQVKSDPKLMRIW
jgi:hypothetical protein